MRRFYRPRPRRDERAHSTQRERDLARVLASTLRHYAYALDAHPCPSCSIDLRIMQDKARALGVTNEGIGR